MSHHDKPTARTAKRFRVHHFARAREEGSKITALTAYDAVTARIFDEAGIDVLLVGDSIGNVMHGHDSTLPVTVDDLVPAARAVARTAERAFVVVDMPFGSYESGPEQALGTAVRFMKETGAAAVKLEGGARVAGQIRAIVQAGIPVIGHLGYTPQSIHALGGPRVQGRDSAADELRADLGAVADAGACAVVLEMVPAPLAADLTAASPIPTIGIGAGDGCDGQILVWTDMAGMSDWAPRFARRFGEVGAVLREAAQDYAGAVRSGEFPGEEHSFQE